MPNRSIASTFGPRLRGSTDYDYHRGVDIPAPECTPIYAVADGTVRIAGPSPSYSMPLVQIRHYKPGSGGSCANGGCYYSNYLHVSAWVVSQNQQVMQGDLIGYTGHSDSGFEHLHFEIRDGGIYQMFCIHPLAVLPFDDVSAPHVAITSVDTSMLPSALVVNTSITLPASELDLNRIEVDVYDTSARTLVLLSSSEYDFNEWNRLYSPQDDPDAWLTDPSFGGITVTPAIFKTGTPEYKISFSFQNLSGPLDPANLLVRVRALDVAGHAADAFSR